MSPPSLVQNLSVKVEASCMAPSAAAPTHRRVASMSPGAQPPTVRMGTSDAWVVEAWRERGFLTNCSGPLTREDLQAMHTSSWFVRRNRKTPHRTMDAPGDSSGWIARRNRNPAPHAGLVQRQDISSSNWAASSPGAKIWQSTTAWMKGRLPRDVRPLYAEPRSESRAASTLGAAVSALEAAPAGGGACPSVQLTLYDLCTCCNGLAHRAGVGVYHSGIVVDGVEYTYDNILTSTGTGVVPHVPYYTDDERRRTLPLRCILSLGSSRLPTEATHELLRGLSSHWHAHAYDIVEHNCHHWCMEAAAALRVAPPPPWVTRAGAILKFFSGIELQESGSGAAGGGGRSARTKKGKGTEARWRTRRADASGDDEMRALLLEDSSDHLGCEA
jgi:hypothetical protein